MSISRVAAVRISMAYNVGQRINIGYYGGFHNKELKKASAEVISESLQWVKIRVFLPGGITKTMFGPENELQVMEQNYYL